ncbi:MAG: hypothetical protein ACOC35_09395 [Promethearchaeia archaeon]
MRKKKKKEKKEKKMVQTSFFKPVVKKEKVLDDDVKQIIQIIDNLDINSITPVDAMQKLIDIRKQLEDLNL